MEDAHTFFRRLTCSREKKDLERDRKGSCFDNGMEECAVMPNETTAKKIGKFVIDTIQILHRIRKIICEKIQQKSQVENSAKSFLAKKSAKLRELSRAAEKA